MINVDDAHGVELADRLEKEGLRVVRYAVKSEADITAREAQVSQQRPKRRRGSPAAAFCFYSCHAKLSSRRNELTPLTGAPHNFCRRCLLYSVCFAFG